MGLPQLIYTRVTADFSPIAVTGWQCVFATAKARPADLDRLIDAHAIWEDGDPTVGNFQVDGDRWIRVFVSPLDNQTPGYNNVIDESWRRGVRIFHAFPYPRSRMDEVVFSPPIRTIDELVQRIEQARGTRAFSHFDNPVIAYGGL